ncbi:MAG: efflux RND transporter periplasmic adaptor subunit [Hyphomicrobiales bacterium]|nr:efflux RND transporter periplasmic adaptor subunit [Hyphomicrobiales bacterium]
MNKKWRAPLGLFILAILVGGAIYGLRNQPKNQPAAATEQAPALVVKDGAVFVPEQSPYRRRIQVAAVSEDVIELRRELPAVVEADPSRNVNVLPPVSGRVTGLYVKLGDRVALGQTLATIQSGDLAQARADIEKARATVQLTKKSVDRTRELAKIGGGAVKDYEQAQSDYAQASAELSRAQQRLRTFQSRGDLVNGALAVKAPFEAIVATLSTAVGAFINDTTAPIMTLANADQIYVTAMAAEKDLPYVTVGAPVEVRLTAFPATVLKGKIASVAPSVDADTHRAKARIFFENPDGRLRTGMFAIVAIAPSDRKTLFAPTSALFMNNDETSVFVETQPWTFKRRVVEVGPDEKGRAPILKGLSAGDRIVVRGGILLND